MTTDQNLHLLAVLAWPFVSLIGLIAAYRLAAAIEYAADRAANANRDKTSDTSRWLELASNWLHVALPALIRAATTKNRDERLAETCERSLLTILAANGGFPSAEGDDVGRQLVREIRKMYAELDRPTPAPSRASGRQPDQPGDQTDPLDPDEVFANFDADDDDTEPEAADEN